MDPRATRGTCFVQLVSALALRRDVEELLLVLEQLRREGVEGVVAAERRDREGGLVQAGRVRVPGLDLVVEHEVDVALVVRDDLVPV